MSKTRLEAFSDGVIAILITIMVLELRVPEGTDWAAVRPAIPSFLTYVLSFVMLGIYWNNHHHLLHAVTRIDGGILWANLHLLFWLSLIPFATAWMGEHHSAALPNAAYGTVQLLCAVAYHVLQRRVLAQWGPGSRLATAIGSNIKGRISLVSYAVAIPLASVNQWISDGLFVFVALLWLIPDRRVERALTDERARHEAAATH
jgi:uncharacterized membrane protein